MRRFLALTAVLLFSIAAVVNCSGAVVNPPSGGGSGGSSTNAIGTDGTLAKFTGTNALRNSIATQQGTTNITVVGTLSVNGTLIRTSGSDTNDPSLGIGAGAVNGATNTGNYGIGSGSLGSLTTGHSNVGLGKNTGAALTSGYDNTYLGTSSGAGTTARENTGLGKRALSGGGNAISNNVAVGVSSGANLEGHGNTFLGYQAAGVTTGSSNTVIGHDISAPSATANNQLSIMNGIFGTGLDGTGTTIQSAGKIGIMTNAPGFTLDVSGTIGLNGTALPSGSGTTNYVSIWNSANVLQAGLMFQSGNYWLPTNNNQVFLGSSTNRMAGISSVLGNFSGNVQMGTSAVAVPLALSGAPTVSSGGSSLMYLVNNSDVGTSIPIAGIASAVNSAGAGSLADMSIIHLGKENATSGNVSSRISFLTRINSGSATDKFIISAGGTNTFLNGTSPTWLQIYGTLADGNNYERSYIGASSAGLNIGHEALGTGVKGPINFYTFTNTASALTITTNRGVQIAGGTPILKTLSATATLNFGSILAAASADLTITVTGAAVGDVVSLGLPAAPDGATVFNGFVSASDTVTVRCYNIGAIAVDPASSTYRAMVVGF